ncbi:hypothetical protein BH11BAC2_BH11BAC2_18080 [soil metagenome]
MKLNFIGSLIFCLSICTSYAQRTVGLLQADDPNADGYILFAPIASTNTWLIDQCGHEVHQWGSTYRPGQSVYLLEDGSLLRAGNAANTIFLAGGRGGIIEKLDWNSNVIWSYSISSATECQHHDICPMPNGNVLAIVWELKTVAQSIAEGRNPALLGTRLWSEKIMEIQPQGLTSGNIVWEWHLWDHLIQDFDSSKNNFGVVNQHPELININYNASSTADWIHSNAIDYNGTTDQILLSNHAFNEIIVIDHSTTTLEAAGHSGGNFGHGGDLLYRWGNPESYNRGTAADEKLFGQHNAQWIKPGYPKAGKIIVFNNGIGRPAGNYSTIDIIQPPIDSTGNYSIDSVNAFLPDTLYWNYTATNPTDFYGINISGVNPLVNGGYSICVGPSGRFFTIDSLKNTVWNYISPVQGTTFISQGTAPSLNAIFRCRFYPSAYPGFTGQTLIAGNEIELNPLLPSLCDSLLLLDLAENNPEVSFSFYPNPTKGEITIFNEVSEISTLNLFDLNGRLVFQSMLTEPRQKLNVGTIAAGIYFARIQNSKGVEVLKLVVENK